MTCPWPERALATRTAGLELVTVNSPISPKPDLAKVRTHEALHRHIAGSREWRRWGGGYRLDHLIVSAEVEVPRIQYLHDWRQAGLSDHSPLLATLELHPID